MVEQNNQATEAVGQSISVRDSIGESAKDRNESVAVIEMPRETSVSQANVHAEKIVSGKEGTVTEMNNHGNVSANNVASTKYVEDFSGNQGSESYPQGVKSASVVTHHGQEVVDSDGVKREANLSQNTMIGNQQNDRKPTEEMSQLMMDGMSMPDNGSALNKITKDNPSTLQQMNAFSADSGIMPDSHYEQANSNAVFKQVGVTQPIYSTQIDRSEEEGVKRFGANSNTHKRLIDRKKQQAGYPVKVTNLNSMVQIRKKKPKMKYNDRLVYRSN